MRTINIHEAKTHLVALAHARMPFGKYAGRHLTDLPEAYVLWFKGQGYPPGKLGDQLREVEELKTYGLEGLMRELRQRYPDPDQARGFRTSMPQ